MGKISRRKWLDSLNVILLCLFGAHAAKLSEDSEPEEQPKSAIIAIEIVDPSEKTDRKNAKRTIESSLGYGYQNNVHSRPKFQIYKYSQHDIPPYRGPNNYQNDEKNRALPNYYQAGTTLFSTINQHGQIGDFSNQLPAHAAHGTGTIPVIVLRVLPAQLTSSHLYPNLPQSNAFAPLVNSLDIKSLLNSYFTKMNIGPVYTAPVSAPASNYQPNVGYQEPSYGTHEQYYSQPSQTYQNQVQYNDQGGYEEYQSQTPATQIYQSQTYEPIVYKSSFDIVKSVERQPDYSQYQGQQYLPAKAQSNGLLTHENYPSKSHTRVIFKTPEGHIRTTTETPDSGYQYYQASAQQQPEPNQNVDYSQYTDQNYAEYADNTAEADYSEQQINDPNQYTYEAPQQQQQQHYYNNPEPTTQKVVYIYPKAYGEKVSSNKKRVAPSTEYPKYDVKSKKQKSV